MSGMLGRALSIRPGKGSSSTQQSSNTSSGLTAKHGFSFTSLRGSIQPELSRKLYRLIKSQNNLISAHESSARERKSIGTQLSEWGEQTADPAVVDLSDKVGVVLAELGELDETYSHHLDDSRTALKTIRNTEKSVQPSRDARGKIADDIGKLKVKEPESTRILTLEQELVRAEAENLVAEAQLSNITRRKFKDAYAAEFTAVIERAEKQIILAKHGRRLLALLDDSPVAPGDERQVWQHAAQARQILNDAEDDLREWQPAEQYLSHDASSPPSQIGHQGAISDGRQDNGELARYVTADSSTQAPSVGRTSPGSTVGSPIAAENNTTWHDNAEHKSSAA